jgi:hypothetical protein
MRSFPAKCSAPALTHHPGVNSMHRFRLLSACLAVPMLLAAPPLTATDVRAQAWQGATLFTGTFCPRGAAQLGTPLKDVRLCAHEGTYMGSIVLTATNWCRRGTFKAEGQRLPINQYTALYSILGNRFGGDARSYFQLPNLRPPIESRAMSYCVVVQGEYPPRQ